MTSPRAVLWRTLSEPNFQAWVMREAERNGVCGFHVRDSQGVVQGVHTKRQHGHSDAHGFPDWVFKGPGGAIVRELKTEEGIVLPEQRRWLEDLSGAGWDAKVWRPSDEEEIRNTFKRIGAWHGLSPIRPSDNIPKRSRSPRRSTARYLRQLDIFNISGGGRSTTPRTGS
jgi:hypothetical protein